MQNQLAKRDNKASVFDVRPLQPTQAWNFSNALSLLKTYQDPYIFDALDEFLLMNGSLYGRPIPFTRTSKDFKKVENQFTLRNVLYSGVSSKNNKDAEIISDLLDLDYYEVLRVIVQTNERVPEMLPNNEDRRRLRMDDDGMRYHEEERILLYSSRILREQRIVLKLVIELLNSKSNSLRSTVIQNLGREIYLSKKYISEAIDGLEKLMIMFSTSSFITGYSEKLDALIHTELVLLSNEILKVLVELLIQNPNVDKEVIRKWFLFMDSYNFLSVVGPAVNLVQASSLMQALAMVISLLFLDIENAYGFAGSDSYFTDVLIFKDINHSILTSSILNTVVAYTWSIVLLRKFYLLESFEDEPHLQDFEKECPRGYLEKSLNEIHSYGSETEFFASIAELSKILKFDNIYPAILSSVLLAAAEVTSFTPDMIEYSKKVIKIAPNSIVQRFFENEATVNEIVLARAKFPLLLNAYLEIASANGSFALEEFKELKSYMTIFPNDFFIHKCQIDDEDPDLVKTTEDIDVFPPFETEKRLSLVLPKGTKAKILPNATADALVVAFIYQYNGWSFLGRILQNISKNYDSLDKSKMSTMVNIIELMTKTVDDNKRLESQKFLNYMSAYTDDSNIVEVILRLMEQSLHARAVTPLEAILNFLSSAMPFLSSRIWPYLFKSSLLSIGSREGLATTIFGAVEMVNGRYNFTASLIKFCDSLVQNCLSINDNYLEKLKALILSRLVSHLISVFEYFSNCTFNEPYQKLEMGVLILDVLSNIVATVYGVERHENLTNRIFNIFQDAASIVVESFLVSDREFSGSAFPILCMLDSCKQNINLYEINDISGFWYDNWIRCSLAFCQLIISIRSELTLPASALESALFYRLPLLVDIYSQYENYRKDIIDLLVSLSKGVWEKESKPSLLSYLGRDHAQVLLHSLSVDLSNTFDDYRIKISLYEFICSVLDGNQEGLSVLFTSGRDLFGDMTKSLSKKEDKLKHVSLLVILKKSVSDIQYFPNSASLHLVDAIALAFNSWSITWENENDLGFIDALIRRISEPIAYENSSIELCISTCYEMKLTAKIAETLALILFATRNRNCVEKIANFFTTGNAFNNLIEYSNIRDYKPRLQANLQLSFRNAYPGFVLQQFTRSYLKREKRYGTTSVYSLSLLDKLFGDTSAWPTIKEQIISSSVNIQYLDAQLALAKSYGALLTSFCRKCPSSLQPGDLSLACQLLRINMVEEKPAKIFEEIFSGRIELAFLMSQTIFSNPNAKPDSKVCFDLLKCTYDLLLSSPTNFSGNLDEENCDYRPLFCILHYTLDYLKDNSELLLENTSIFREIFDTVVTKATNVLLIDIQNEAYLLSTVKDQTGDRMNKKFDDLKMILSLFKVFVRMKNAKLRSDMATLVNERGTIAILLRLYSFSHMLSSNNRFIFAQLSLMFIQELLVVEDIAECLISSGLLLVLTKSEISRPIVANGCDCFLDSDYHKIWNNGILPIFLICLSKLRSSCVEEIVLGLRIFAKQIETCIESWLKDSSSIRISSALVSDTSQILMLFQMLQEMNAMITTSEETTVSPLLNVFPLLDTESKREDFVDSINNLLKHPKFLSSRIVPCSSEEQRIFDIGGQSYEKFILNLIDEIRELLEIFK